MKARNYSLHRMKKKSDIFMIKRNNAYNIKELPYSKEGMGRGREGMREGGEKEERESKCNTWQK